MLRRLLLILLAICAAGPLAAKPRTTVMVVASLHGFHAHHPTYDYDKLYALVARYHPDVVGVEIRPEDIGGKDEYLAKSYPREMIALRDSYRDRAVGFDWLGDEIAGRPIPDGWWQHGSKIKALEREMDADPAMKDPDRDRISQSELELIKSATARSLADGRYYRLVQQDHASLARSAAGTRYEPVVKFTADRDSHIDRNLVRIVRANMGRRIVFVMGADHHGFAVDALRRAFGRRIGLVLP